MATKVESSELETLSNKIYKAYYDKNPRGDARNHLWGAVLKAKKEKNPVQALNKLLAEVENAEAEEDQS